METVVARTTETTVNTEHRLSVLKIPNDVSIGLVTEISVGLHVDVLGNEAHRSVCKNELYTTNVLTGKTVVELIENRVGQLLATVGYMTQAGFRDHVLMLAVGADPDAEVNDVRMRRPVDCPHKFCVSFANSDRIAGPVKNVSDLCRRTGVLDFAEHSGN